MRGDDLALMSVGWLRFRIRHILTLSAGPTLEILSCPSFSFKSLGNMTKRNLKKIQTGQKQELGLKRQTSPRLCKLSLCAKMHVNNIYIVSVVFGEFYLQHLSSFRWRYGHNLPACSQPHLAHTHLTTLFKKQGPVRTVNHLS